MSKEFYSNWIEVISDADHILFRVNLKALLYLQSCNRSCLALTKARTPFLILSAEVGHSHS